MLREKMELLRKKFTDSIAEVEGMLAEVSGGLVEASEGFLEKVAAREERVNQFELELDFFCTSIISLYAPEARDLRTVLMILKMTNDVERIGDLLYGVAKVVAQLREQGEACDPELRGLLDDAGAMFKRAVDAFFEEDAQKADAVLADDDAIDQRRHRIIGRMLETIAKDPDHVRRYYSNIKATQKVERIADHATNIAEDVIYMIKATSVKHQHEEGHGKA